MRRIYRTNRVVGYRPAENVPVPRTPTNPIEWRAAQELIRRGLWKVVDSKKHWFWEWKAIERV